jgi:nicotinate-nucleotide adenylyltransferase
MCRLSIEDVAGLEVDERETRRDGPTFTIDTLESFPSDEELVLILGADAASRIKTWQRWEDVLQRANLAVAPRPGADLPGDIAAIPIEMGLLEISGTEIRDRVRTGKPFRFLVTRSVHDYIKSQDLYAERAGDDMVEAQMNMESSS